MLVIVCRADFTGGIPETELSQSEQLTITDGRGNTFGSSCEYFNNDVGTYRDYVQVRVLNPARTAAPKRLKIRLFLEADQSL